MDYQNVIDRIHGQLQDLWGQGRVADYIPALAKVDPRQFGIAVATLDGQEFRTGDAQVCFSIQSISKVFTLAMVTGRIGDDIWKAVGREPSGNPFNSLVQLEYEHTDRLISLYPHPKDAMLEFVRALCANDDIYYDKEIARSERLNADRNLALAYFMKSFGNIENDVETLLDVYCHQCAISMSCADLARAFLFLSNRGVNPFDGRQVLTVSQAKRLGALMLTCGFYDESGDFAFRAGLPGKSGVGGGIAAYIPGNLAITVWSPELNRHGNSLIGMAALEHFTTDIGNSIF